MAVVAVGLLVLVGLGSDVVVRPEVADRVTHRLAEAGLTGARVGIGGGPMLPQVARGRAGHGTVDLPEAHLAGQTLALRAEARGVSIGGAPRAAGLRLA